MQDTNLFRINLKGADLFRTNLKGVDLTGVDISNAFLDKWADN